MEKTILRFHDDKGTKESSSAARKQKRLLLLLLLHRETLSVNQLSFHCSQSDRNIRHTQRKRQNVLRMHACICRDMMNVLLPIFKSVR